MCSVTVSTKNEIVEFVRIRSVQHFVEQVTGRNANQILYGKNADGQFYNHGNYNITSPLSGVLAGIEKGLYVAINVPTPAVEEYPEPKPGSVHFR